MTERVEFLGLTFDRLSLDQAAQWLADRDAASRFAYAVTPNVDHLVRLSRETKEVARAYADADLCLCDSRVLARLAAWCRVALPVAPGSDLVAALFATVLRPGDRVCIIGAGEDDAVALRKLHPTLDIVQFGPPMGLRRNGNARRHAVNFAVAAGARVTLIAVGSPQQELLAHAMSVDPRSRGTALCIGASVEFLTGKQLRAPAILRRRGVEWAWRLLTQPRRLSRRYLLDGPAILPLVWRWHRDRVKGGS